jgi:hypothetical protein
MAVKVSIPDIGRESIASCAEDAWNRLKKEDRDKIISDFNLDFKRNQRTALLNLFITGFILGYDAGMVGLQVINDSNPNPDMPMKLIEVVTIYADQE